MTSTTRILPPINEGTALPAAPCSLPAGLDWRTMPGSIGIATGFHALGITSQRGRTRKLRRMAERTARKAGAA